jgi:hypothetical protein
MRLTVLRSARPPCSFLYILFIENQNVNHDFDFFEGAAQKNWSITNSVEVNT